MGYIVAIVGRPNVGKSTLFNRLAEDRHAITDDLPGVTRDRHYGTAEWNGKQFTVVDTGGWVNGSDDVFEKAIREQVEISMEEADALIFLTDVESGLTDYDREMSTVIRRSKKPVLVAVNKCDNSKRMQDAVEFYSISLGHEIYPVSAASGSGTGELLDALAELIPPTPEEPEDETPRIAIVGQPNVGKSSFVNLLLGENRNIVTPIAGTTRDAVDTRYNAYGHEFIITDTAGIRRKTRVTDNLEFYSVLRAIKALEASDVCVVMFDATQGLVAQDLSIISLALKRKKGIVLLANKWDLVEKDQNTYHKTLEQVAKRLEPNHHIPVMFISVHDKQRIFQATEKIIEVYRNKHVKIPTSKLNQLILPEIEKNPPPSTRGKFVQIKYITQLPAKSPTFLFFCNMPQQIKVPYQRYIENKLRSHFNLEGAPVTMFFRKK